MSEQQYACDRIGEELGELRAEVAKLKTRCDELQEQRDYTAIERDSAQQTRDRWIARCNELEAAIAVALDFLRKLKRNIDESGALPKYDGAAVEAIIHVLSPDNPKLKGVSDGR